MLPRIATGGSSVDDLTLLYSRAGNKAGACPVYTCRRFHIQVVNLSRISIAAALSAAMLCAQGPGARAGSGTPPDPTTMIQMRVNHLTTLLDLSDAQKTQALTIFTNAYNASQTAMTMLKTDRDSLANAIKTNNTATIDQLSATIGGLEGQVLGINAKANAAFYAILTPDQQTKYDALGHGPGAGPGPGFGPRFHGGPPPQ